jgi:hypothetical protein
VLARLAVSLVSSFTSSDSKRYYKEKEAVEESCPEIVLARLAVSLVSSSPSSDSKRCYKEKEAVEES